MAEKTISGHCKQVLYVLIFHCVSLVSVVMEVLTICLC